jgi:hypothetical protein
MYRKSGLRKENKVACVSHMPLPDRIEIERVLGYACMLCDSNNAMR